MSERGTAHIHRVKGFTEREAALLAVIDWLSTEEGALDNVQHVRRMRRRGQGNPRPTAAVVGGTTA